LCDKRFSRRLRGFPWTVVPLLEEARDVTRLHTGKTAEIITGATGSWEKHVRFEIYLKNMGEGWAGNREGSQMQPHRM